MLNLEPESKEARELGALICELFMLAWNMEYLCRIRSVLSYTAYTGNHIQVGPACMFRIFPISDNGGGVDGRGVKSFHFHVLVNS